MNTVSKSRLKRIQKCSSIEVAIEKGHRFKQMTWARKDMLSLSEVALLFDVAEKTVSTCKRQR